MSKVKRIVSKLKKAADLYYNKGESPLTDEAFDQLKEQLKEIAPGHSFLQTVGAPVDHNQKVELPVAMGSLSKLRPAEVVPWMKFVQGDLQNIAFHITPKFDGLSGLLHYRKGKLQAVYTRGDGKVGRNIITKAKYIQGIFASLFHCEQYPKEDLFIKGEIVIQNSVFQTKYRSDKYKNARNFCVGMLNRKELDEEVITALRKMVFLAVSVELKDGTPAANSLVTKITSDRINYLPDTLSMIPTIDRPFPYDRKLLKETRQFLRLGNRNKCPSSLRKGTGLVNSHFGGKRVGQIVTADRLEEAAVKDILKDNLDSIDILQDGLVIRILDTTIKQSLGNETNSLNPKWSKSIKLDQEDQESQLGEVDRIEWKYSKRQLMKPLIVLKKPLDFNGVEVSNISGQNVRYIETNSIGPGAKLKIIRSGDVIPYITGVEEKSKYVTIPGHCPYCDSQLESTGVDLHCANRKCGGLKYMRVISFFTSLKTIEDVSDKTFQSLYDEGFTSVKKILNITIEQLMEIEGFQRRKAEIVYSELQKCTKDVTVAQIMHASGFFNNYKTSLGQTKLQLCIDALGEPNILDYVLPTEDQALRVREKLEATKGLSSKSADIYLEGIRKFNKFYKTIEPFVAFKEKEVVEEVSQKLAGVVAVFTGFRNPELEELITANGGEIGKGVTNKTTHLFAFDATTTKAKKAAGKGIPIIAATAAPNFLRELLETTQ